MHENVHQTDCWVRTDEIVEKLNSCNSSACSAQNTTKKCISDGIPMLKR